MNKQKGLFLTFEGPEASGKSSQILLLEKYLKINKIYQLFLIHLCGYHSSNNSPASGEIEKLIKRI